jgi:hypothetical protein
MNRRSSLEDRWMNEARNSGFSGPEYEDEPEWIFAKVRDLQHKLREAEHELEKLKRTRQLSILEDNI